MGTSNKHARDVVTLAIDTVDVITKLTANPVDDVLAVGVRAAIAAFTQGTDGQISIDESRARLHDVLGEHAAAARERLRDKFDPDNTTDG